MIARVAIPGVAGWLTALSIVSWASPPSALADEGAAIRIGGTGIALAAMRRLGDSLTEADPTTRVEVLPSLGTPGGIRALAEREIDIAVVARELTPKEQAQGLREAACFRTAMVFASSHRAASGIARAEIPGLYANPSPKWPDGTPLKVILRSRAGSENAYLIAAIPQMAVVFEGAYKRPGMPVGSTDQENADLAVRTAGSLAIMTLLQHRAEQLKLKLLPLDGVDPTVASVENGSYPMPMRICTLAHLSPPPPVAKFVAHLQSKAGQDLLRSFGAPASK